MMEDIKMEIDNPYDGWSCYECEVTEQATKIIRIFGKDEESTRRYLEEIIDTIDMNTGIDEYKKTAKVCEPCMAEYDYTVPDWWYE
jgi:hypothetical protein